MTSHGKQGNLILVRGLPGSGKTTLVKRELPGIAHFEADAYFTDSAGNYVFDGSKLKEAHEWCYRKTAETLKQGKAVVVSNTFTTLCEMRKYLMLESKTVTVIEVKSQYQNIHGVPDSTLQAMRNRWQDVDWKRLEIETYHVY